MTSHAAEDDESSVPARATSEEPAADVAATDGPAEPPRRRARRRVLLVVAGVLVVLVLATGWLAFRVYQAGRALTAAQDDLGTISQEAHDGDLSALEAALPGAQHHLRTARQAVDDPVWKAATVLPWAGRQLTAVRTVTVALDDVVTAAGPVLHAVDGMLGTGDGGGSGLDIAPLVTAAPDIQAAATKAAAGARAVAGIDTTGLTPRLVAPVRRVQDEFAGLGPTADTVSHLAAVLPGMLGGDGPRTYLLASLNSAELRAQGGIAGAFAVLRVDGSSVRLVEQRSTGAFQGLDQPVLPLTAAEDQVFTDRLGRYVQDALLTPDFPRAAQLLAARWTRDTGEQVDGVIATDVVAVADVMRATGPVTTPSGVTLDADSVIPQLLQQAYLRLDRDQADAFFGEVAASVFGAVTGGHADPRSLVRDAADAAGQGRVRLWSAHDDEQAQLLATTIGGAFLTGPYPDAAGVFLDDGTGGKLDYYLTTAVTVEDLQCTGPDPTATVRIDLSYKPPDGVAALPWWVVGIDASGLPPGDLATNVSVYAPVGAPLTALGIGDGQFVSGATGSIAGRAVQTVASQLAPGESVTYRAQVPIRGGSLPVWSTPTLTSGGLQTAVCTG
ncbi:MAG TPA: DUF4012 domain-containing protein [Cellulomonas sp.]